uniref:Plastid-encoded RNA polymerase subunit alpha n=1 Tax=Lambia antarctica TaxID=101717 RepID=A0A1L2EDV9_9CHLO|nr:DNA-directed RNA polymerase subunit alpha [Lambia antarctica]ANN39046.1 DNA-directed RNA polymerase subunit alpha [Lambia antarctica]
MLYKNNMAIKKNITFSCLETRIDKSATDGEGKFYASFQLGSFPQNQGLTVANALRRTLLSEASQCSITGVLIEDIKHEYSSIKGIKDTVFDILLNLKKIIFYSQKPFFKTQVSFLSERGPMILKAKHLKLPSFLFCINPEQYVTTLETNSKINMTFFIDQSTCGKFSYFTNSYYDNFSKNFFPFTSNLKLQKTYIKNKKSHFLFLDTQFSPICNLNYKVKKMSSFDSRSNDKEIIFFEIWTNGSIHPSFLLKKAIQNLLISLIPFYSLKKTRPLSKASSSPFLTFPYLSVERNKENKFLTEIDKVQTNEETKPEKNTKINSIGSFEEDIRTQQQEFQKEIYIAESPPIKSKRSFSNLKLPKNIENPYNIFSHKKFIQKFINLDLTNFPLSLQTYESLKKSNILTVGDLYKLKIQKKQTVKMFTKHQLVEIRLLFKHIQFYFYKNK